MVYKCFYKFIYFYEVVMKKQIFTLLLSAFIITTNPLFAMEDKDFDEKKFHSRPLTPEEIVEQSQTLGDFHIFSNEAIVTFLTIAPLSAVGGLTRTSTEMHSYCEDHGVWKAQAKRFLPALLEDEVKALDTKKSQELIKKYYNLFKEEDKNYKISMDMFKYFIRQPVYLVQGKKFNITLGKEKFVMEDTSTPGFFVSFFAPLQLQPNEDAGKEWNNRLLYLDTKPFFQDDRLKALTNELEIGLAADSQEKCFKFTFDLYKDAHGNYKLNERWQLDKDNNLLLTFTEDQFIEQRNEIMFRALRQGGMFSLVTGNFKIYKKPENS